MLQTLLPIRSTLLKKLKGILKLQCATPMQLNSITTDCNLKNSAIEKA
jgi:hypothetical protein